VAEDIIVENAGRSGSGQRGEKRYGGRNFAELYAVFSAPQILKVLWGASEVGSIDVLFAQQERVENLSFVLGAKAWRAVDVDFSEGVVHVEPMPSSNLPRWQGRADLLGRALCQAIRSIVTSAEVSPDWSQRAQVKLAEMRTAYDTAAGPDVELVPDEYGQRLWTFAGGKANNLLARTLEGILGEKVTVDNLYVGFRGAAAASDVAIRQAIDQLRREGRPNHDDALRFAENCGRGRLSKFQPCLPQRLEAEYLAEVLTNEVEARAVFGREVDADGPDNPERV
jgi:ATP-dependent Lhr-like helicase